jgi:hypothetical protein
MLNGAWYPPPAGRQSGHGPNGAWYPPPAYGVADGLAVAVPDALADAVGDGMAGGE